jgi:hypothetical protein
MTNVTLKEMLKSRESQEKGRVTVGIGQGKELTANSREWGRIYANFFGWEKIGKRMGSGLADQGDGSIMAGGVAKMR